MTVAADMKSLFQVTRKKRFDSLTDQYQRIFMVKLLLACSIITGLAWYGDKINCVNPGKYVCINTVAVWFPCVRFHRNYDYFSISVQNV